MSPSTAHLKTTDSKPAKQNHIPRTATSPFRPLSNKPKLSQDWGNNPEDANSYMIACERDTDVIAE